MERDADAVTYEIEYLPLPTLADLFVFGRLTRRAWERMLDACDEFLTACAQFRRPAPHAPAQADMYLGKTPARLERQLHGGVDHRPAPVLVVTAVRLDAELLLHDRAYYTLNEIPKS